MKSFYVIFNLIVNTFVLSYFWDYFLPVMYGWEWDVWGTGFLTHFGLPLTWNSYLWGFATAAIPPWLLLYSPVERGFCYLMGGRKCEGVTGMRIREALNIACSFAKTEPESYDIYMIADPTINARTTCSKSILVNTGAANKLSVPELAGVIAHELGHLANKDNFYRIITYSMCLIPNKILEVIGFFGDFFMLCKDFPGGLVLVLLGFILSIFVYICRTLINLPIIIAQLIFEPLKGEQGADYYACEIGLGLSLYRALEAMGREKINSSMLGDWCDPHLPLDIRMNVILDYCKNKK